MDCLIRTVRAEDYEAVVRIMNQVQQLHIDWRPDLYRHNDCLIPQETFDAFVAGGMFYVAEAEGRVVGLMGLAFQHAEAPAHVKRDVVLIDTMAVDAPYRGRGIGHRFFEKAKAVKEENGFDGIELHVNAKNKAAYAMYANYGFTEKAICMELR